MKMNLGLCHNQEQHEQNMLRGADGKVHVPMKYVSKSSGKLQEIKAQ